MAMRCILTFLLVPCLSFHYIWDMVIRLLTQTEIYWSHYPWNAFFALAELPVHCADFKMWFHTK